MEIKTKQDLVNYIEAEMNDLALKEAHTILKESELLKDEALIEIEEEAKNNAKLVVLSEIKEAKSNAAIKKAAISTKMKKDIIGEREKLVNNVFKETKDKLDKFVASKDYKEFIAKKLNKTKKDYNYKDVTILMKDSNYKELAIETYSNADFKEDDTIVIGGFKIITNTGIIIDETLDTLLNEQKEWFYNNAKLNIK
ncbi:MAG: hypothetical protein RR929_03345 [Erysipelotrichaceae bacterium]